MGCDIHFFTEIKINDEWLMYDQPGIRRNYMLFAKMAGVRNYWDDLNPISPPKGIPNDISKTIRFIYDYEKCDAHSESWLSSGEVMELYKFLDTDKFKEYMNGNNRGWQIFGYLFGNDWTGFVEYKDEMPDGLQDFRWVFWFDN